jgi:hypothetical protein
VASSDLSKKSLRTDNNVIIQQIDENPNMSTKLLKLVTNSSSSIKMLSYGDSLSSALRIPTRIHLTKTSSTVLINQEQSSSTKDLVEKKSSVVDYPLTPPPPIADNKNSDSHVLNKTDEHERVKENSTNNIKGR